MRLLFPRNGASLVALLSTLTLIPVFGCGGDDDFHPSAIEITLDGPATDTVSAFRRITVQGVGGSIGITDIRYTVTAGVGGATQGCISIPEGCATVGQHVTDDGADTTWVGFGQDPGTFAVRIQLLGHEIDTAITFTVLPGAAASARIAPGDTTLQVGATGTFVVHAFDRFGNQRDDSGVVTAIDPGLPFVPGTQVATGAAIGRYRLVGTAEGRSDTIEVSVVPDYTIAGITIVQPSVIRRKLDRSGGEVLLVAPVGWPASGLAWGINGTRQLTYARGSQPHRLGEHGGTETAINVWDLIGSVSHMAAARDSNWIFTEVHYTAFPFVGIGRFHLDGSGQTVLTSGAAPAQRPSPTPDGTRFAYVSGDGAALIKVRTIGVGDAGWSVSGRFPSWSPTEEWIAYLDEAGGHLNLLDPDDGSHAVLTADSVSYAVARPSWSKDGLYLTARRTTGQWDLIRVSDGLVLPLHGMDDLNEIVFEP